MSVLDAPSRSLKEYRLLPGFTDADGGMEAVRLSSRLCRLGRGAPGGGHLSLETPILSAAMGAVTGGDMAIALAQLGGLGVVPVSQSIDAQVETVAAVKRFKAGFQTDIRTLSPGDELGKVAALMNETGYNTFPVTDTGLFHGRLLGVLTDKDFDPRRDLACRVADRMRKDVQVGVEIDDLDRANQLMVEYGRGVLPIVSEEGTLLSVVFKKDRDKHLRHPQESVDESRRLRVAAAISTHPEDRERVRALQDAEVDVLSIDASDGHTAYQAEMLRFIREHTAQGRGTSVIAGNVVTAAGFTFLAEAGADAVKVGMGIGSGCTTQAAKATGRGQATALREIAAARDRHEEATGEYIPLIADGGIEGPAEIVVALALGADTVMLGNLLARFSESPGALVRDRRGDVFKEYWMEGSRRGANNRRYAQARSVFFEEGIEGLVPHAGSIHDGLPSITRALQSSLATAGCLDVAELHAKAVLELQSVTSLRDAGIHGMEPADVFYR